MLMRRLIAYFLLTFALLMTQNTHAAPGPCSDPSHHDFDFWIGHWQVHTPDGKLAGTNRIEREYDGCVLHERYHTDHGYSGESLNAYDMARNKWHQTWVDNEGLLLLLEGGLIDNSMVLEGNVTSKNGKVTRHRITWTPNADASVRQHWQSSDDGTTWETQFDGRYTRVPTEHASSNEQQAKSHPNPANP